MSKDKLQEMVNRKNAIKELKFQKTIENAGGDVDQNKLENSKKIQEILEMLLTCLKTEIKTLAEDKQIKISQWINLWTYYLACEDTFDPSRLMTYKRGDIVHVNFGFNVHNELGGSHYAVVVEVDNPSTSGCITVVPLRSEDTENDVLSNMHARTEVYLGSGILPCGSGKDKFTVAKVNQIRTIDKMRILKPTNDKKDKVYPLDPQQRKEILDKIDEKIIELFTKPKKEVDKGVDAV